MTDTIGKFVVDDKYEQTLYLQFFLEFSFLAFHSIFEVLSGLFASSFTSMECIILLFHYQLFLQRIEKKRREMV
jgi:hypothetical protein